MMGNFIYVARGYTFENVCVIYIEYNILSMDKKLRTIWFAL